MSETKTAAPKFKEFRADKDARDDDEAIRLIEHPDSTEEIPVLDLAPHLRGEPGAREKVAAQLKEATETVGFFYLKGHGIPQDVIDKVFGEAKRFHGLPEEQRRKVPKVMNDVFRSGYEPISATKYSGNSAIVTTDKPSKYNRFSINWESDPAVTGKPTVNVWPENLPGFQETLLDYQRRMEALARSFLPLWATVLKLPLDYFDRYFDKIHLLVSLLHYPPQKEMGNREFGVVPHTDNTMMTFLAQGEIPGLAVRMPSGHWKLVERIPGALVVNTGNLIVRWTNDQVLSTKHRVINTNPVDRYSLAAFFGPSPDALIECLPTCQSAEHPAQYEPITYRDLRKWYFNYE